MVEIKKMFNKHAYMYYLCGNYIKTEDNGQLCENQEIPLHEFKKSNLEYDFVKLF